MIYQKEIREKSQIWKVPPDTVDKDYVLGHFLSVFSKYFNNEIVFKGGTCLRKCYFENYRFSEDLDFSSLDRNFKLEEKHLKLITDEIAKNVGIQYVSEDIKPLQHNNILKGYQVYLKYWGANHLKNQQPPPHLRWNTKIKLEISTEEKILLSTPNKKIHHPYSDELFGANSINCYSLEEVIAEKLRALKQRSYTAPRDFYDLYELTNNYSRQDWENIKPLFIQKMEHKNLVYNSPKDLINNEKLINVKRAWATSVSHQIKNDHFPDANTLIQIVADRIQNYLTYEP